MAETLLNKNQIGSGIYTEDNLVAGTNISMTQETETTAIGLDEYTQLYVPFNDVFTDFSDNNCVYTAGVNCTASVSSTGGKFEGELSAFNLFDGNKTYPTWKKSDNSYLVDCDNDDEGYTVEYWQYIPKNNLTYGTKGTYLRFLNSTQSVLEIGWIAWEKEYLATSQIGPISPSLSNFDSYTIDGWNHICIIYKKNTYIRIFVNGTMIYEYTDSAVNVNQYAGYYSFNSIQLYYNGANTQTYAKIDELRVSNTVRYTANFTVPSAPFGTLVTRDVTKINNTQSAESLGTGYDATKTQVLKNVQGVLTWVDEA